MTSEKRDLLLLDIQTNTLFRINTLTGDKVPFIPSRRPGLPVSTFDLAKLLRYHDIIVSNRNKDILLKHCHNTSKNVSSIALAKLGLYDDVKFCSVFNQNQFQRNR